MSKFLRLPDVMAATGLGRSSIYAYVREKDFPPPIKIGPRASAWDSDEISKWQDERKAERDGSLWNDNPDDGWRPIPPSPIKAPEGTGTTGGHNDTKNPVSALQGPQKGRGGAIKQCWDKKGTNPASSQGEVT